MGFHSHQEAMRQYLCAWNRKKYLVAAEQVVGYFRECHGGDLLFGLDKFGRIVPIWSLLPPATIATDLVDLYAKSISYTDVTVQSFHRPDTLPPDERPTAQVPSPTILLPTAQQQPPAQPATARDLGV